MVHGVLISAVIGSLTGVMSAVVWEKPLLLACGFYLLGGLLAVVLFILATELRTLARHI